MKAFVYYTAAIAASCTSLGILFKGLHWPGANILLILGIATFSLMFVPSYLRYRYLKA